MTEAWTMSQSTCLHKVWKKKKTTWTYFHNWCWRHPKISCYETIQWASLTQPCAGETGADTDELWSPTLPMTRSHSTMSCRHTAGIWILTALNQSGPAAWWSRVLLGTRADDAVIHPSQLTRTSGQASDPSLFLALPVSCCSAYTKSQKNSSWKRPLKTQSASDWLPAKTMENLVIFLRSLFSSVWSVSEEGCSVLQESYGWVILWIPFFQISSPFYNN